ncbi:hypothetical protein D9M71_531240 [compost metagenome]
MAQGKNRTAGGQADALRPGGQVGQVSEGVEDLPRIAEERIEQRHVPDPDSSEPESVDLADKLGLSGQDAHIALIEAQRQKDAQRQLIRREHPVVARVSGKGGCAGASGGCVVGAYHSLVHADSLLR